jgi:hypothetical protein
MTRMANMGLRYFQSGVIEKVIVGVKGVPPIDRKQKAEMARQHD